MADSIEKSKAAATRQTDRQTDGKTNRQTDRQKDRQTKEQLLTGKQRVNREEEREIKGI